MSKSHEGSSRRFLCAAIVLGSIAASPLPSHALTFSDIPLPGSNFSGSMAVADLNGDGNLDLVRSTDVLEFLAGNGDGTFDSPVTISSGAGSSQIAIADMNADAKLDLVVAGDFVFIHEGRGDGTFDTPRKYKAGKASLNVAVADLNGDGIVDIAGSDFVDHKAYVLIANKGGFKDRVRYDVGNSPRGISIADMNQDGKLDLIVGSNVVSVLLGNGDGTFQPQSVAPLTSGPSARAHYLAISDFNGDGKLDVAANQFTNVSPVGTPGVHILLGNGDGTLGAETYYPLGTNVDLDRRVGAADLNQDGIVDVAINFTGFTQGVHVLLGNGDGTFTFEGSHAVTGSCNNVTIADLNADLKNDLITDGDVLLNLGPVAAQAAGRMAAPSKGSPGAAPTSLFPNPLRGRSTLSFSVARAGPVSVRLVDLSGRVVRTVQDRQWTEPGLHQLSIDRQGLASGMYFYQVRMNGDGASGRFVVMD